MPQRVDETIGWVEREMTHREGGFASSLDADSEHEEGKFYVWSEAEIDAVLGDRAALVQALLRRDRRRQLGRAKHPQPARRTRPRRRRDRGRAGAVPRSCCCRRARRGCGPGWDDKVLADWNGLMIAALADAGLVFERPDWIDAARRAFDFVRDEMTAARRPAAAQLARRAGRGIRPASTITRICAAPRWRCTRRPATHGYLEQAGDWVDGARPALLGRLRRRLFLRRRRHAGR